MGIGGSRLGQGLVLLLQLALELAHPLALAGFLGTAATGTGLLPVIGLLAGRPPGLDLLGIKPTLAALLG